MHVVLSWDISNQNLWSEINEQLKTCISNHSWVKPLTTLYIVKVYSSEDLQGIIENLTNVARKYPGDVNIVCTPLMTGGTYNGWLPKNMWDEINARTL